jgi:hypothetical protein
VESVSDESGNDLETVGCYDNTKFETTQVLKTCVVYLSEAAYQMKEYLPEHQSYLLRLWPVRVHGETVWRAQLVHIPGMQGRSFADLERMVAYLKAQIQEPGACEEGEILDKGDLL